MLGMMWEGLTSVRVCASSALCEVSELLRNNDEKVSADSCRDTDLMTLAAPAC